MSSYEAQAMGPKKYLTGCQLRQYLHISTRKLKALMDNNIIPHVDTGLKTHKYLVRYEDAEYYASHRDLKKEYEITQKQKPQKSRSKLTPLPDSDLFGQYLRYKWRNKSDALTTPEIIEMLGIGDRQIGRLVRNNILYTTKIGKTRFCSKNSLIRYASSDHSIRYVRNATYVALLRQSQNWKP